MQWASRRARIPRDELIRAGIAPLAGDAVHVELPLGSVRQREHHVDLDVGAERQRRVRSPIEPSISSPVSGSTGVWPERNTRPLETTACE